MRALTRRPPAPKPAPQTWGAGVAPEEVQRLPGGQVRPSPRLPAAVSQAATDSEVVLRFIACDALGFYLQNGYLPAADDWPTLYGGYMLSRIPAYTAQQLADELGQVVQSEEPFAAAAQVAHEIGCI